MELLEGWPARRAAALLAVLAALGLAGGYAAAMRGRPQPLRVPLGSPSPQAKAASPGRMLVHVAGAVQRPGVYALAPGARVDEAVRAAGGPTAEADLDAVNLAARLRDGDKVLIPVRAVSGPGGGPAGGLAAAPGSGAAAGSGARINLNTATEAELDQLPGIGPALAARIVAWRSQHGGFRSVEDLGKVPGIGPKKLAELKGRVTV